MNLSSINPGKHLFHITEGNPSKKGEWVSKEGEDKDKKETEGKKELLSKKL